MLQRLCTKVDMRRGWVRPGTYITPFMTVSWRPGCSSYRKQSYGVYVTHACMYSIHCAFFWWAQESMCQYGELNFSRWATKRQSIKNQEQRRESRARSKWLAAHQSNLSYLYSLCSAHSPSLSWMVSVGSRCWSQATDTQKHTNTHQHMHTQLHTYTRTHTHTVTHQSCRS